MIIHVVIEIAEDRAQYYQEECAASSQFELEFDMNVDLYSGAEATKVLFKGALDAVIDEYIDQQL